MASIKISDTHVPTRQMDSSLVYTSGIEPREPSRQDHNSMVSHADKEDGIYNIRSRSELPKGKIVKDVEDDGNFRFENDLKKRQVFSGKLLLWLAYQSIGVIYGDIGTSPLYVYSSTFSSGPPSRQDLIGVLSLIIWSLFMMVTVKYAFIILRADNDGEGGTFSTYSLLSRYTKITDHGPHEASLVQMKRHISGDLKSSGRQVRRRIENSPVARIALKIIGVLAVTMVIADGLLTPAQSVLGAVQGIQVVDPGISKSTIIGVTDAILIVLFLIQPLGITKITVFFSPIVIIWLGFNAVFGIYNLVHYDAGVFKAFNPAEAFMFLVRNGETGWRQLGGVLLCFTGLEAMFADLGAFSRRAVQISWLCYTFPCLLLAYIGQAAYISVHPEGATNPFFNAAPPGTIYPALVIAILAAVVASQAIITATFQLLNQVMKLSYFPQIKVIHTSEIFHGQIYVPMANWLLMIGTVLVASIYNNTTSLGNAYGVCVMFVTIFDTIMVGLVAIIVWQIRPIVMILPFIIILCMDGTFLSSVLIKIPDGAWFTLALAAVLALFLLIWRFGKEQQWAVEAEDRLPTSHFFTPLSNGNMQFTDKYGSAPITTTPGIALFFDKVGDKTPIVFSQFVLKLSAVPGLKIFVHLRPLEEPSVTENRFCVARLGIPNCYRVVVRYGYNDEIITPDLAGIICGQVTNYLIDAKKDAAVRATWNKSDEQQGKISSSSGSDETTRGVSDNSDALLILRNCLDHNVLYVMGKEQMKIKSTTGYFRTVVLWIFLWVRENTRNRMANLKLPIEKMVEIGFLKEI